MRTLIVSDLHLGMRRGLDVLRRPRPLEALVGALAGVDRLVLLGDVVELMDGRPQQAMGVAAPVLRALAAALDPGAEVVVVPGNHDHPLVRSWVRRQRRRLRPVTPVPREATPRLAQLCGWLAPARVKVRYPGVWLREDVWATHGHYVNAHLFPRSGYGISRGLLGREPSGQASPGDYERRRRGSVAVLSGWLPQGVAAALPDVGELVRAAMMPRVRRHLLHPRLAPLTRWLLEAQMHLAAVPALSHVVARLEVEADWIVFGHVHRLGPLAEDPLEQWQGTDGAPAFVNTGSWLYEPLLLHRADPPHPYWPGGAVVLEDHGPPRPVGLLDGFRADELR